MKSSETIVSGVMMDTSMELSLLEICRLCDIDAHFAAGLVEEGVIEPVENNTPFRWRFNGLMIKRVQIAVRLRRDLDINLAGIGMVIDLLEELQELRQSKRR
ncbi:MAG: chaperone modulatory protein CbpM [Planctomycetota bacterium]|jgi:chaperone modulatory protein CbpM